MAFMNKHDLELEAERLGISDEIKDMTWPQKQGALAAALKIEKKMLNPDPEPEPEPEKIPEGPEVFTGPSSQDGDHDGTACEDVRDPYREAMKTYNEAMKKTIDAWKSIDNVKVVISPEIAETSIQRFKYDEELGYDKNVSEVSFETGKFEANEEKATYIVSNGSGRKVYAQSTFPKLGSAIEFVPTKDVVPTVKYKGRKGYIWKHPKYKGFKDLLEESGYFSEYRNVFNKEPYTWYAAGIIACDINKCHQVMREIEKKEQERNRLYGRGSL